MPLLLQGSNNMQAAKKIASAASNFDEVSCNKFVDTKFDISIYKWLHSIVKTILNGYCFSS